MILQRQFTHFSNTVDMVNERMNPCLRVLLPQPQVSTFLSSGHLLDLISFSSPFLPATKSPSSWENEVLLWVQNLGQPKAAKPIRWQNHVMLSTKAAVSPLVSQVSPGCSSDSSLRSCRRPDVYTVQLLLHDPPLSSFSLCPCAKLLQSCLTLCNPVDYNPLGSSVHWIFQARILEQVAIPFSTESS